MLPTGGSKPLSLMLMTRTFGRFLPVVSIILFALLFARGAFAQADEVRRQYDLPLVTVDEEGVISAETLPEHFEQAGVPDLPFFSELIEIPTGMMPKVEVEEVRHVASTVGFIRPIPTINFQMLDGDFRQSSYQNEFVTDDAIYQQDQFFPNSTFESEIVEMDGKRFVRVSYFPLRYNPLRGELRQAMRFDVTVEFVADSRAAEAVFELSICCDLPLEPKTSRTKLPVGQAAVKIAVEQEGIYELTYAELVAIEPTLAGQNPNNFAMLTNGEAVAFQVVGGDDDSFDAGDVVRFYGWPFDGPRIEKQFVKHNIFWLWADGDGTIIETAATPASPTPITSYREEVTLEEDLGYTSTNTHQWDFYDNEPDAWYWEKWSKQTASNVQHQFEIELSDLVVGGSDATLEAEFLSGSVHFHTVGVGINGLKGYAERSWAEYASRNVVATVDSADLISGTNTIEIVEKSPVGATMFFNRVTLAYDRALVAESDRLQFGVAAAAAYTFDVTGFESNQAVAWDISNRYQPAVVSAEVLRSNPFTYRVIGEGTEYAVSAEAALLKPTEISSYQVVELDTTPTPEWIAITHDNFAAAATTLANHRASYSELDTAVISADDIINQYGYGLPTPNGIRDFLAYTKRNWSPNLQYVVLVGDASINPRELDCTFCESYFTIDPTYVPTFLPFSDRFIGMQPSDHPYTLLTGSDELPDIAVGRLTVENTSQADAIITKIIQYESNLLTPQPYMQDIVFLADADDPAAGFFCDSSQIVGDGLDDSLNAVYQCLEDKSTAARNDTRTALFNTINSSGIALLNYRGHGSVIDWAGGLMSRSDAGAFTNRDKPFATITADCLDGHFAWYNLDSIGETFLREPDGGSAAHWSASGLGFLFQYQVLHVGFYDGLFDQGLASIGDAINYAKTNYHLTTGYEPAPLYSMNLQGDPAMQLLRPDLNVTLTPQSTMFGLGDEVVFTGVVNNRGVYPVRPKITITLPPELSEPSRQEMVIEIDELIGLGESAEFTLTALALTTSAEPITVTARASSAGLDVTQADQTATTTIQSIVSPTAIQLETFNSTVFDVPRLWEFLVLWLAIVTVISLRQRSLSNSYRRSK